MYHTHDDLLRCNTNWIRTNLWRLPWNMDRELVVLLLLYKKAYCRLQLYLSLFTERDRGVTLRSEI